MITTAIIIVAKCGTNTMVHNPNAIDGISGFLMRSVSIYFKQSGHLMDKDLHG